MKKYQALFLTFFLFFSFFSLDGAEKGQKVKVGVVMDNSSPGLDRIREALSREMEDLLSREFEVVFTKKEEFLGGWSVEGVRRAVDQVLDDPSIDLVVGIGGVTSNELAQRKVLNKPVFAPFVINPEMQNLSEVDGKTGVNNLNYLTFPTNLERDFSVFHALYPFKSLAVVLNGYVVEAIPSLMSTIQGFAERAGVTIHFVPVKHSIDELLKALPSDADALYIVTLTQMSNEEIRKLSDVMIARQIPTFSLFSRRYLEEGIMASMSPDRDLHRLLRRVALNIQRVLLGENAKDLDIRLPEAEQLTINMETVRALGISLPWEVIEEAVLINVEEDQVERLKLQDAIARGLERNFDLLAVSKGLRIGNEDLALARSNLRPQAYVNGVISRIDRDRAKGSFGVFPEKAGWVAGGFSQKVYSNRDFGRVRVEKFLQRARCSEYDTEYLDTVLAIAKGYLDLLRATTVMEVHRNNLERTRSHLKLAEQRVKVGTARSSEMYRWESQFATDMTTLTTAKYQAKSAETELRRLINYPYQKPLFLEPIALDASYWLEKKAWLEENIVNDRTFDLFVDYSVCEGLKRSKEIARMRQLLCAQCEELGIATREFWAPELYLEGSFRHRVNESGAGSNGPALFNRTNWTLAVNMEFPLYLGGAKRAVKRQAAQKVQQLRLEMASLVQRIETHIRTAAYEAVSSYKAIALSERSAMAAGQNLKLVQDSYSKGVVPIVDLLDAQNQALVADLVTANTVYDCLCDLMIFQRGVGYFDFLIDSAEQQAWKENISRFFQRHLEE